MVWHQDVVEVSRSKVVDDFKCQKEYFVLDPGTDWEPVETLKHRGDIVESRGPGDQVGCRVLNSLQLAQ